jgi:hypothetical protein
VPYIVAVGRRLSGASIGQRPLEQRVGGTRTDAAPDDGQEIFSKLQV